MKALKKSTLDHLLPVSSRSSSANTVNENHSDASPPTSRSQRRFCRSKTASSCELFSILKALAATSAQSALEASEEVTADDSSTSDSPDDIDEASQRSKLEEKMRLALDKTATDSQLLGSRLAALSLADKGREQDTTARPPLPQSSMFRPQDTPDFTSDISLLPAGDIASSKGNSNPTQGESINHLDGPTDEEKIQAIIEEYGSITDLQEGQDGGTPEPERMLADCKGSLFKGIMVLGQLHLTTHRLLFHAQLPPESLLVRPDGAAAPAMPDVLIAGPVTWQKHGPIKSARRLWMEVGTEMITTYPNGDEVGRTRPLQTLLLSSVRQMRPYDPADPRAFVIITDESKDHDISFRVDTEQSALQWRRALEAAIFRYARRRFRETLSQFGATGEKIEGLADDEWATLRCSIPLDRVKIKGISHFHDFALLVGLEVDLDGQSSGSARAEDNPLSSMAPLTETSKTATSGGRLPLRFLHTRSSSAASSRDTSPSRHSPSGGNQDTPRPRNTPAGGPTLVRHETHYLDAIVPDRLASVARSHTKLEISALPPTYDLNMAVFSEQSWFAEALQAAVGAATERRYRPGVVRPRMRLDVGGFDCLSTDEELEARLSLTSRDSDDLDHHEDGNTSFTRNLRKTERAALAAKTFGLEDEAGVYIKRCYFVPSHGMVSLRGHIIIARKFLCFWRRVTIGADVKYRFPLADVKGVSTSHTNRAGFHGMAIQIQGQHDVKFEFWSKDSRDEVMTHIEDCLSNTSSTPSSPYGIGPRTASPISTSAHPADILAPPKDMMFESPTFPDDVLGYLPFVANRPFHALPRLSPRHFVCLTIGSRGDVQPYIALCLRLKEDNHRVTIVTHVEFREWIESYGIEHRQAGGDPTALMKLSTDHKMFSPGFFKESLGSFRQWLDDLLLDSWHACHDAAVLIESPSTMAGIHIAEGLKIPYFRAFTMPWTRTTAYPQAFMVPAFEMGPSFNYSTYVLFDSIMWRATAGQINRWRKKHLHLPATDMSTLSVSKVPFLYNFSPAVVPKALDWSDDVVVTGYWNLENSDADWSPPASLEAFMTQARADGKPLVYIGFGSIVVPHPNEMTRSIITAVDKADVRAIVAKGWSSRGADPSEEGTAIQFPSNCYGIDKIPHGWLFPKIDAALHHGGAGTVGASLRAGLPTLVKPWFGDQFFWAIRVSKLGVGLKVSSLRAEDIAHALKQATTDKVMIEKAGRIGERIRSERGVDNAVQAIQTNIIRAGADRSRMTD